MQLIKTILSFCFSVLLIMAPALGLSSEKSHEVQQEQSCCNDSCDMDSMEMNSCHSKNNQHSTDDCEDNCNNMCGHACHLLTQTLHPPISNSTQVNVPVFEELKKTTYYQDLSLQHIIFQFWHPPKFVSYN